MKRKITDTQRISWIEAHSVILDASCLDLGEVYIQGSGKNGMVDGFGSSVRAAIDDAMQFESREKGRSEG